MLGHMNKASKFTVAVGLYFAVANIALKIIGKLLDGEMASLSTTFAWTAIYWFFGGSLIGYTIWRTRKK